jgi:Tol biopolymer transport system component
MRGSHVYCWTFDQKYLIWGDHQPDGAEMDIYRLDMATGEIVDLTQESAVWDAFPACSPVNDQIAFVSDRQGSSKENDNIWVMDSQGENLKQVTNTQTMFWENQFPGWSPDGSEIAFFRFSFTEQDQNGPPGIWAVKPDGSGERLVIEIKDLAEFNRKGTPIWSPDGKYIAYSIGKGERNIYIVPTSGGELLWRCDLPGVNSEVSWSANSKHLIFTNSLNDIARIYIIAIDDLKPAPLLPDPGNFVGMFGPGKKQ